MYLHQRSKKNSDKRGKGMKRKNVQGMVTWNKARPVAKAFLQIPGMDFNEVFSSVSRGAIVSTMILLSVKWHWKRSSLNVKNAFVNANVIQALYMEQSEEFMIKGMDLYVYQL